MNDLVKNLLLWVVVAIVLMMVFQSFSPNTAGPQEVQYSQFMEEVRNNRIRKVDIAEDERTISFERTDGARGTVIAPRRDERMIRLRGPVVGGGESAGGIRGDEPGREDQREAGQQAGDYGGSREDEGGRAVVGLEHAIRKTYPRRSRACPHGEGEDRQASKGLHRRARGGG